MIKGEKVRLRAVERADLPKLWQWRNDDEVMYYWVFPGFTVSMAELEQRFTRYAQVFEPTQVPRFREFIIETLDGTAIGIMAYMHLDIRHRHAEVIIQLGEKDCWGQGYGTDAMMAFLDYLFNELNLNRVYLHTQPYNPRAIASYEKCGFVREGVLRQWYFVKGQYHDSYLMSILRGDFKRRTRHEQGV